MKKFNKSFVSPNTTLATITYLKISHIRIHGLRSIIRIMQLSGFFKVLFWQLDNNNALILHSNLWIDTYGLIICFGCLSA